MCNNTLLALLVFVVSVSCFADKPPQGTKCGIGTYGCKGYGADHCCSAYGYCGNTDAHCNPTLKTAPCKCDCIDGGVPCDNRDSTKVDYCKGPVFLFRLFFLTLLFPSSYLLLSYLFFIFLFFILFLFFIFLFFSFFKCHLLPIGTCR